MGVERAFTTRNLPLSRAAACLFLNSLDFSFLMKVKSDAIKDVSFAKMSELFAIIEAVRSFFFIFKFIKS